MNASNAEEIDWSQVTALFGGAFDPPHEGHREAVLGLLKNPGVKRVIVIPTGRSAWKKPTLGGHERMELAKLAFHFPHVEVSGEEIERAQKNPSSPTFAWDTILQNGDPSKIAFVIGSDQLASLPQWHRFPEILTLCHWIVLERSGEKLDRHVLDDLYKTYVNTGTSLSFSVFPTPARKVSSAQIREHWLQFGEIPKDTLSPEVAKAWIELMTRAKKEYP